MSKYFAAATLVFMSGCAAIPGSKLTKAEIIALTEKLSYEHCHTVLYSDYPNVNCEFHAYFRDKTWSVGARSIFRNAKGEILQVMGAESVYIFTPSGELLRWLPGM